MTLRHMDFKKHCRLVFELYVEAHDDPNITTKCPQGLMNELHSDPPEISKGKIRFFLTLGRVLKEKKITLVVGTDRIINIVDGWGGDQEENSIGKQINIRNRNKEIFIGEMRSCNNTRY